MKRVVAAILALFLLSACQPKDSQPGPIEQQATVTEGVKVVRP